MLECPHQVSPGSGGPATSSGHKSSVRREPSPWAQVSPAARPFSPPKHTIFLQWGQGPTRGNEATCLEKEASEWDAAQPPGSPKYSKLFHQPPEKYLPRLVHGDTEFPSHRTMGESEQDTLAWPRAGSANSASTSRVSWEGRADPRTQVGCMSWLSLRTVLAPISGTRVVTRGWGARTIMRYVPRPPLSPLWLEPQAVQEVSSRSFFPHPTR